MTNRNILTIHSHWMLLKKSPLSKEQRRSLCFLLRTQGGTQMPLDLKVSWLDLSCAPEKISSWTPGLRSSLLTRVCFLLLTATHGVRRLTIKWWGGHCDGEFTLSSISVPLLLGRLDSCMCGPASQHSESLEWVTAERKLCGFWNALPLTLAWPQMLFHFPHLLCPVSGGYLYPDLLSSRAVSFSGTDSCDHTSGSHNVLALRLLHSSSLIFVGSLSWCTGALNLRCLLLNLTLHLVYFLKCSIPISHPVTAAQLTQVPLIPQSLRPAEAFISSSSLSATNWHRPSSLLPFLLICLPNCSLLLCIYAISLCVHTYKYI